MQDTSKTTAPTESISEVQSSTSKVPHGDRFELHGEEWFHVKVDQGKPVGEKVRKNPPEEWLQNLLHIEQAHGWKSVWDFDEIEDYDLDL